MTSFVFATAGHIDHGKTQLIKALTGMDTDRLKEEKERGISIELGFAYLTFADGRTADIIDVPGHERFIHTMVAGVTSIDAALVVIAGDEGVMPQTQEHVDILSLLGVKYGMLLLTKADLVQGAERNEVRNKIQKFTRDTFLHDCPMVFVSSITGEGIEEAKAQMAEFSKHPAKHDATGNFFLPVDRVFTMKGFGTVITGTLRLGSMKEGEHAEILPHGLKTSVRGLQVHKGSVKEALQGQRTAVNLSGIQKESVLRGNVIAKPGCYKTTQCFDAEISVLTHVQKPLANRQRFHIHLGTSHALCRIILLEKEQLFPGETSFAQIITEAPVVTYENDRFILRTYSPMHTVSGGKILDPHAARHKRKDAQLLDTLKSLSEGDKKTFITQKLLKTKWTAMTESEIQKETGWTEKQWAENKKSLPLVELHGNIILHRQRHDEFVRSIMEKLAEFHTEFPQLQGMNEEELKNAFHNVPSEVFSALMQTLKLNHLINVHGSLISLHSFKPVFSELQLKLIQEIEQTIRSQGLTPPSRAEVTQLSPEREKIAQFLVEQKKLIQAGELLFHGDVIEQARKKLLSFFQTSKEMEVQDAKNLFPVTRKFLIPLLEYFDSSGLTIRVGNKRILRIKR